MKKLLALVFALVLLCAALPVLAEDGWGLTFSPSEVYKPVSTCSASPNTFEAWVKLRWSKVSGRNGVLLGNYGLGSSVISFEIHQSGRPRLYWTDSAGVNTDWIFNEINVCTGDWVHVAIVRDVDAGEVRCYIGGELLQTLPIPEGQGREATIPAGGLYLGGDARSNNDLYFKGAIRQLAVFSDVRTQTEIQADMLSPAGQDDLLLHYDLTGQAAGADVPDLSGNGCGLRYVHNVTWISPEDKAPVTDYAYAFAFIGDTQNTNRHYTDRFPEIYSWILENIESRKIRFVFGLGDITDADTPGEWVRAKKALHTLDGKVDYAIVRGNHDSVAYYTKAFPWADYQDSFDGSYDGTMLNTYRTLTIGQMKYLLIGLDFGATDDVLAWAGRLCEQYPDHNVIITTHAYLNHDGTTLNAGDKWAPTTYGDYNDGDHMWDKLLSRHGNIVLIVSGHIPSDQIIVTQETGVHGNIVTQMLIDPQDADLAHDGLGMVALLCFSEDGRDVTVEYYSTLQDKYFMSVNQFTMTLDTVDE